MICSAKSHRTGSSNRRKARTTPNGIYGHAVIFFTPLMLAVSFVLCLLAHGVQAEPYAEPDPPVIHPDLPEKPKEYYQPLQAAPTTEWTFHKTPDGVHPNDNEQQRVWLMNRARANPAAEGIWLATTSLSDVASGRDYWGVDVALLQAEFASYSPKPPAAFDVRLYYAAKEHSEWMIEIDAQLHGPPEDPLLQLHRIANHGFTYNGARGNIFARAQSAVNAHAALNIDWGWSNDGSGMQAGRGHRLAIMSIDNNYSNVGIAMLAEANPATWVGPLVVTGNYCRANTSYPDHYNRFLVGTVWQDLNRNNVYDPGEGLGNVTVMPDHGSYYAVTSNSGGYAVPITAPGLYEVTFSGPAVPGELVKTANIGDVSVLLDLRLGPEGDVNGDGGVDLVDAILALQVISGLNPEGVDPDYATSGADVNGDCKIGWEEVVYILQRVLENRT